MKKKKTYHILACDPGSKDFGIAILEVKSGKITPIKVGKLDTGKHTVVSMDDLKQQFDNYRKGLDLFCGDISPDLVVIERFIARGVVKGALGERISFMIALTIDKYATKDVQVFSVLSCSWKNSANKKLGFILKEAYKKARDRGIETHELDATLLGVYAWNRFQGNPSLYGSLESKSKFERYLSVVESAKTISKVSKKKGRQK